MSDVATVHHFRRFITPEKVSLCAIISFWLAMAQCSQIVFDQALVGLRARLKPPFIGCARNCMRCAVCVHRHRIKPVFTLKH